jgi:hypothetical protein
MSDLVTKVDAARVRELLIEVWGTQACQVNPSDWPRVFAAYMQAEGMKRGSFKPFVDAAVPVLTALVNGDEPILIDQVWRAFSKLDKEHCAVLAQRLEQERGR